MDLRGRNALVTGSGQGIGQAVVSGGRRRELPVESRRGGRDPRRIREDLAAGSLVLRYEHGKAARDGIPGGEGYFSVCSFWLVEAMARAGCMEEAQLLFDKLLSYANHLGLFSEEIGSKGQMLGNFPQALTHLGLISAAYNLDRMLK